MSTRCLFALALVLLPTTFAAPAHAQELVPAPEGRWAFEAPPAPEHYEQRRNLGLMAAGLGVFGGAYIASASAGYAAGERTMAIPVAGPLLQIGKLDQGNGFDRALTAVAVMDSMIQAGGIVMAVVGATTTRRVKVPNALTFAPSGGPGGASISLGGRF